LNGYPLIFHIKNNCDIYTPDTKIIAAAFADTQGNHKVFYIDDYISFGNDAEKLLLTQINDPVVKSFK
jgi:hypothetical protein